MTLGNEDLSNLTDEELAAMLAEDDQGDESTSEDGEAVQDPQGVPVPQPSAEEMQAPVEEQAHNGGNYQIAMQQERDARKREQEAHRQTQAERDELIAFIQQQQERQQQPELALEDPEAIRAIFQQEIAPYVQQVNYLTQENQQLKAANQQTQREKDEMEIKGGNPDFDDASNAVDQQMPHLSGLPAKEKLIVGRGLLMQDPEYLTRKFQAQLDAAKQAGIQTALAKGQQPGVKGPNSIATVSSVTPGLPIDKDPRDMSDEELEAASK